MENTLEYIKQAFELKSQNCYKQAIELLYKALEIEADNIEILFQLGELYYLLNNSQRGIQFLEKVISKNPNHLDCATLLKKIYIETDDLKNAIEYAQKCFEVQPNSKNLLAIIELAGQMKDFDKIAELEKEDLDEHCLTTIANFYYINKKTELAKEIIEKIIKENPQNDDARILLGKIYFDKNNL